MKTHKLKIHSDQNTRSKDRYKQLLDSISDYIYSVQIENGIPVKTIHEHGCEKVTGYSPSEYIADPKLWLRMVYPDDRKIVEHYGDRIHQGEKVQPLEHRIIHKDGSIRWVRNSYVLKYNTNGILIGYDGIISDITERKQAETLLKSSEEKYRRLYETILEGFVHTDMNGNILETNNSYLQMLGYNNNEICQLRYQDITPTKWHNFEAGIVENQILPIGHSALYEKEYIKKDGTIFPVELQTYLIKDNNAKPSGMWAFVCDITERKRIQEALRESEGRLTALLNASSQPIILLDINGTVLTGNIAILQRLELSLDEFIGKNAYQFLPQELAFKRKQMIEDVIHSSAAVRFEDQRGDTFFDNNIYPVLNDQGNVTAVAIFSNDITESKRAEKLLRESESQLRQVIDLVPHFIFAKNRQGQFILVNQAVADTYGTTVDNLLGKTDADFNPNQEEIEHFLRDDNEVMDNGQPKDIPEEKITDSKGKERYLHTIKIPYSITSTMEDAILGVSTDITERKEMERSLKESEEQFRNLAEESPNMIFINQNGKIVFANNKCSEIMGYSRKELLSSSFDFRRLIAPDSLALIQDTIKEHLSGKDIPPYECSLKTKGDKYIQTIINTKLINYFGQSAILGIVTDITERKYAEEALMESEAKFRGVTHTSVAAIFIYQGDRFIYANPATEIISGYPINVFLEKNLADIVHPDFLDLVIERANARQRGETVPSRYEFKIVSKSGEDRWLDFGTSVIQLGKKPAALCVAFDITERKTIEDQLQASYQQMRQLSARLEEIREKESAHIAREIHDELGQILTGIKMDLSFIEDGLLEHAKMPHIKKLFGIIESSSKLVDNAINTVRKITSELRPAILDSLGLLAAIEWQTEEFQKRTGIKCTFKSLFDNIQLDKDRSIAIFRIIQESLTNILRHSKATIVTINFTKDDETLSFDITDNGRGITIQELKKIGSFGILGMKERAALLGGRIDIKGLQGKGTTVSVRIPFGK